MSNDQSSRKLNIVLAVIALILAVILAGMIVIMLRGGFVQSSEQVLPSATSEPSPTPVPTPELIIDANVGERVTPTPIPVQQGISIPGWGGIRIPAGVTEAQVSLNNPEANADLYYLTFELRLKDTGEVIFTTGLIPPGLYCNKVTLTRPLETGEYEALMHVQPYRMDEKKTPTNNADMDILLIVY